MLLPYDGECPSGEDFVMAEMFV